MMMRRRRMQEHHLKHNRSTKHVQIFAMSYNLYMMYHVQVSSAWKMIYVRRE